MIHVADEGAATAIGELRAWKRGGVCAAVNVVAEVGSASDGRGRRYVLRTGTTLAEDLVAESHGGGAQARSIGGFIVWAARMCPAQRLLLVLRPSRAASDPGFRSVDPRVRHQGQRHAADAAAQRPWVPDPGALSTIDTASFRIASAGGGGPVDGQDDELELDSLARALLHARRALRQPIDVVALDGGLPATIEVAHPLRDAAHYLIGSEQGVRGSGWPYQTVLAALSARPQTTSADLARLIVRNYLAAHASHEGVTQSALALARSAESAVAVRALARLLQAGVGDAATRIAILQARAQVQRFDPGNRVDLADLCDRLQALLGTSTPVGRACERVIDTLEKGAGFVTAAGSKGADLKHARGVAIEFPGDRVTADYARLDFARASGWAKFLQAYHEAISRRTRWS